MIFFLAFESYEHVSGKCFRVTFAYLNVLKWYMLIYVEMMMFRYCFRSKASSFELAIKLQNIKIGFWHDENFLALDRENE